MVKCPVCNSQKVEDVLSLKHQPIYQHPVLNTNGIKKPYFKNLYYSFCKKCEHCFQKIQDISVLDSIYQNYYYTPRPTNVGAEFQNNFMQALIKRFKILNSAGSILEIGCSAGEILTKIAQIYPDKILAGYEPNRENAGIASDLGFLIYNDFFTDTSSQKNKKKFEIVFHRHVIEHVIDLEDFFKAHDNVCHSNTSLIIETPCLNWTTRNLSMAPFHIEHIHIFSIKSLKKMLEKHHWYLKDYLVTPNGYLIGFFNRKECNKEFNMAVPEVESLLKLTLWIKKNKKILKEAVKGKKLALWGAGSGGIKIINYFHLCPDIIIDNNPGKAGKKFVGYEHLKILEASGWIEQECKNSQLWLIVVASTYYKEINRNLKNIGWKGEVLQPYALSG